MLVISLLVGAAALVNASFHEARAGHLHQRSVAMCGGIGYDLGQNAYSYQTVNSLLTPAACGAQCVAQPKCRTFALGNGACLLYTATIDQNTRADVTSPYTFWDLTCVYAQSLAAPAATTSTATSLTQSGTSSTAIAVTTTMSSSASKSGSSSSSGSATALSTSMSSSAMATAVSTSASSASSSATSTSSAAASSSTKSSAASPLQLNTSLGIALGAAYGAIHFVHMCL